MWLTKLSLIPGKQIHEVPIHYYIINRKTWQKNAPRNKNNRVRAFFYKQRFFSTHPQCCLTFSWIELQMLIRCRLIHKSIIILKDFLYLLYLCPCLYLGLFFSYLCYVFFIFIFIFIMTACIFLWTRHTCSFAYFLEYVLLFLDDNVNEECE